MALSPQKASWRRIDNDHSPSNDVGAGGVSSASGQQSSPLISQDVSSTPGYSPSPSTTLQTSSSPSIAISPSSLFPSPASSSTTSAPTSSSIGFATPSQPLSNALPPINTQSIFSSFGTPTLTVSSLGPSSLFFSKPLASSSLPFAHDSIAPSSPVVQNTLHTALDATLPASTSFPVPASTSPGIDDGPSSLTSTPQIGQSPVPFGGDAPVNSADPGLLDVASPAAPTPTGGQPPSQGITASIPNIDPGSLTSALSPGEIGTSTISASAVAAIATTDFTSIPLSVIPGQINFISQDHDPQSHHDDDRNKKTLSSFTSTSTFTTYNTIEISGRPTSILITETSTVVGSTLVPVHLHRSPNRPVPVAVIAAPILSVVVIIALVLAVLRHRWRLQRQRIQARIQWPTFVGFSQVREMHRESVLRSREEGPPSLPPLQSTVGWNDPSPGAFAFGEPAQDPFAPTPPMIFRPLPDASPPSERPLSVRTIRRVPVPDPFLGSSGRTSTLVGSPDEAKGLSEVSSHDEHLPHAQTNLNDVGWAV